MRPTDPVELARSIVADPIKKFTVSVTDVIRICRALVAASENEQPMISNELAEAARRLIAAGDAEAQAMAPDGYVPLRVGLARAQAAQHFKALFEQEFPNG